MSKRSVVLRFVIAIAVVVSSQQVFGQAAAEKKIEELPVNVKYKPIAPDVVASNEAAAVADAQRTRDRNAAYLNASKVLRGQIPADDAGKKILDEWFVTYYLPSFTVKENRGELPEMRNTITKELRSARQPAALAHVRAQILRYMTAFAQSPGNYDFHPAVRYNAMLLIGELNRVEYGTRYANGQKAMVPEPMSEALDLLISEYKSPTQIDAVRVAALVGLDRHAKLDLGRPVETRMPGGKKKIIVDEMIALLNSTPPATRSPAGHTWMQRRAVDILAALGMVGAYPEANAALEKIVADKATPISLRCTASEALAQWPAGNNKIDATKVSKDLGLIAVKACTDELDRIAALVAQEEEMTKLRELIKKANPAATGQYGSTGQYGMGGGDESMYGGGESMYGGAGGESGGDESMYGGDESMYGGGMGMYGMPGAAAAIPTDPRIVWSQRRLKYQLTCVKRGLAGMALAAGKGSQHEKVVTQVAKAVDLALTLTDPPAEKPDLEGLTESIQKGIRGLAFLAPAAAAIGVEPVTELPPGAAPPGVPPAGAATPPAATADPAAPPGVDATVPELPPGL